MMLTTTLMAQVNIVGETLQGLNGPEMLPLLAEQSEKEVTVFITNINIFTLTTSIITSLCAPKASYAWKIAGFTTCTASCLGGLQESIVICVETEKENPVAPYFCDPHKRLEIEVPATIILSFFTVISWFTIFVLITWVLSTVNIWCIGIYCYRTVWNIFSCAWIGRTIVTFWTRSTNSFICIIHIFCITC